MKIKAGIASYGLSGQVFHAPFINAHSGFELTAIVERSKNLASERYPHVKIMRSFEELLELDIELVVVNTPDTTHYQYCKMALQAGKNVVVEKPFVFTLAEARELTDLARSKNLLITVYQNRRYDGDFQTMKQLIHSGRLGRIVELESAFQRYRPHIVPSTWKETADKRVGITYNLGSHLCDQALVLFGKPEAVWATLGTMRDGGQIDDYFRIEMYYPCVKVSLRAGMLIREQSPRFALHGTLGSYVKYGLDPQEELLKHGAVPTEKLWCGESEEYWGILHDEGGRGKYPTVDGNYMSYYQNIYDVLRCGAQADVTHDQMLIDMQILEAAFESHEQRKVVAL